MVFLRTPDLMSMDGFDYCMFAQFLIMIGRSEFNILFYTECCFYLVSPYTYYKKINYFTIFTFNIRQHLVTALHLQ